MFTKQQLAKWRSEGFQFDEFHDEVAVEKEDEVSINSVEILNNKATVGLNPKFTVKIYCIPYNHRVEVVAEGKIFSTYKQANIESITFPWYQADVTVQIPFLRTASVYKVTARIVHWETGKVLKEKTVNVRVNNEGVAEITDKKSGAEQNVKPQIVTYLVYWNSEKEGRIDKQIPKGLDEKNNNSVKYIYYDKDGNEHEIGVFTKKTINNIYGSVYGGKTVDLVDIRELKNYLSDTVYFRLSLNPGTNRFFLNTKTMGSLLGAMLECSYNDFVYNGFSNEKGESTGGSTSHKNGQNGDLRYLRKDKSGERTNLSMSDETGDPCGWKGMDIERQNTFNDALYKFGWKHMLSQYFDENKILEHCTHDKKKGHYDHLHVQGYKPNYKEKKV